MSIQVIVLYLTLGIILSSGVAIAGLQVEGKIRYKDTRISIEWNGRADSETNTIDVVYNEAGETELMKTIKLSDYEYNKNWKFCWENAEKIQREEVIYGPCSIGDISIDNKPGQTIWFARQVQFNLPNLKLPALLWVVKTRTFKGYLSESTIINIFGTYDDLSNFRMACEEVMAVIGSTNILGVTQYFNIISPLLEKMPKVYEDQNGLQIETSLTMTIPLILEMTVDNVPYKGVANLTRKEIRLLVPKDKKGSVRQKLENGKTHRGNLKEQAVISPINFIAEFRNIKISEESKSSPTYSPESVWLTWLFQGDVDYAE